VFWKQNTHPEVEDASSTSHPEVDVWVHLNLIFSSISLSFDFESEKKTVWVYYYSFGKKALVLIFVSDEEEEVPWTSRTDCSAPPMTLSSFHYQLPFVSSPPPIVFPSRAVSRAWTEDHQSLFFVCVCDIQITLDKCREKMDEQ
jgi:hypothetical protein